MIGDWDAIATVAVHDLGKAREFYENVLGLKEISSEGEEAVVYATGSAKLVVYRSTLAGTSQTTAVNWQVGENVDRVVKELRDRGLEFEHYDVPMLALQGDVHVTEGLRVAWFKDPDGNIHSILNR